MLSRIFTKIIITFALMKFFAFIMAILIMALSVMPCTDDIAGIQGKAKTEIGHSSDQNNHPQQDDCSPFCQCSCCWGFAVNHSLPEVSALIVNMMSNRSAYLPAVTLERALPIWQPPQLV